MPTVEHVGVSRKIDSDSERQRLRKLITQIRNSEDIPSGGFIVRTAGVGISEQVREVAIPMYRRVMHDQQGRLTHQPYGRENQAIYSVSRGGLNRTLLNLTEADYVFVLDVSGSMARSSWLIARRRAP